MLLCLRPLEPADVPDFRRLADDAAVAAAALLDLPLTDAAAERFIAEADRAAREGRLHLRAIVTEDRLAGCLLLEPSEDEAGTAELSYWVGAPFRRRGIATRAVTGCARLARTLGFGQLTATCLAQNSASRRVLEASGFAFAGRGTARPGPRLGPLPLPALYYRASLARRPAAP